MPRRISTSSRKSAETVVLINSQTCGIYKNGAPRYKTDPATGRRTNEIDNQLIDDVEAFRAGSHTPRATKVNLSEVYKSGILVPTYFDERFNRPIKELLHSHGLTGIKVGDLIDSGHISVFTGHRSPGNDQRGGTIPYIKVSDIRGLRININPTNLLPESVARRLWRCGRPKATDSGLQAWDLITPNRASSNIGEFAILVPGEECIVLTKEVFVFRVVNDELFDQFYLLWCFSLKAVRDQWRRIALMQTNREDCGNRHREIIIPRPKSRAWAETASAAFRDYFTAIDVAKKEFAKRLTDGRFEYIANVLATVPKPD